MSKRKPEGLPLLPELGGPPEATFEAPERPALAPEPLWLAVVRNRLVIGAASTVAVLLLIAAVLVAIGRDNGPVGTKTVAGASTPDARSPDGDDGATGTVRTTTSLRNGPGFDYPILGTIPRNAEVNIVGRDEELTWVQIIWPPGSDLRGWVSVAFVDVEANLASLPIADPSSGASVDLPTSSAPTFVPPPDIIISEPTVVEDVVLTSTPVDTSGEPTVTPWPTFDFPTETPEPSATSAGKEDPTAPADA